MNAARAPAAWSAVDREQLARQAVISQRLTPPIFTTYDLYLLAHLPVATLLSWILPEHFWHPACVRLARLRRRNRRLSLARHVGRLLDGREETGEAERIVDRWVANMHLSRLHYLRCHRFDEWRPEIRITGEEHIEHALKAGRGAVLWIAPFVFSDLITQMVSDRRALGVTVLIRERHGPSSSRFGRRVLNPVWTSIERRYVGERLAIAPGQMAGALRKLARRARANGLVAIRASALGRRVYSAPFLNGALRVAAGAPSLAFRSGAALLPVFTVRDADGAFVTTFDRPLHAPPELDREAALQDLIQQYAARLEPHVVRSPDQYLGWHLTSVSDDDSAQRAGG